MYSTTTYRQGDGRYVVKLPFKEDFPDKISHGSSKFSAFAQLNRMEKNLQWNKDHQTKYNEILQECLDLGHIDEYYSNELKEGGKYFSFYLPQYDVLRPDSKTTKCELYLIPQGNPIMELH